MNKEKFVKVTEHYGYYYKSLECYGYDGKYYVIYRGTHQISAFRNKKYAIKECKYLEKLNFGK